MCLCSRKGFYFLPHSDEWPSKWSPVMRETHTYKITHKILFIQTSVGAESVCVRADIYFLNLRFSWAHQVKIYSRESGKREREKWIDGRMTACYTGDAAGGWGNAAVRCRAARKTHAGASLIHRLKSSFSMVARTRTQLLSSCTHCKIYFSLVYCQLNVIEPCILVFFVEK